MALYCSASCAMKFIKSLLILAVETQAKNNLQLNLRQVHWPIHGLLGFFCLLVGCFVFGFLFLFFGFFFANVVWERIYSLIFFEHALCLGCFTSIKVKINLKKQSSIL